MEEDISSTPMKSDALYENKTKHKCKTIESQPLIKSRKSYQNDEMNEKVSKFCCLRWCSLRLI